MINCIATSKGTTDLVDVRITDDAPEPVPRSVFRPEGVRVIEEESDVGEFGVESGEEGGEGFGVVWKVFVTLTLVMVEITNLAELVFVVLLLFLLHLLVVLNCHIKVSVLLEIIH